MEHTKGPTLPKKYWAKGKSKFLHIRLRQEGKFTINDLAAASAAGSIAAVPFSGFFKKLKDKIFYRPEKVEMRYLGPGAYLEHQRTAWEMFIVWLKNIFN